MNKSLYLSDFRCRCKEELSIKKRRKVTKRKITIRPEKSFLYPDSNEITSKTFNLKFERKLSSTAKLLLNSFQSKYLYYAIDDILYLLNLNPNERDNLLAILYSPVI